MQDLIIAISKYIFLLPICIKILCFHQHNCVFYPHWGSKPQCEDYTCSRTKVVSRTQIHLFFPRSGTCTVCFPTQWEEMRVSWTVGAKCCSELYSRPQTWHRIPVFNIQTVASPEPPALWPASATSPSLLPATAHSSFSPSFPFSPCPASPELPVPSSFPWHWQYCPFSS